MKTPISLEHVQANPKTYRLKVAAGDGVGGENSSLDGVYANILRGEKGGGGREQQMTDCLQTIVLPLRKMK